MRYIGLDLGTKSLGIAISDPNNSFALPGETLRFNKEDYESVIEKLKIIINKNKITDIILGLPKNMDNSFGFAVERSLKFKDILEKEISLPIHLVDERMSSISANNILLEGDVSRKKRKESVDSIAASIILETYLKEKNNGR